MVARPTAVAVLHAEEVFGDRLVPGLPGLVALDHQAFADVQVAEEFLAAVGAEAGDELLVVEPGDDGLLGGGLVLLGGGEGLQLRAGVRLAAAGWDVSFACFWRASVCCLLVMPDWVMLFSPAPAA